MVLLALNSEISAGERFVSEDFSSVSAKRLVEPSHFTITLTIALKLADNK